MTFVSTVSNVKELLLWVGLGYGAEVHLSELIDISHTEYAQQVARMFERLSWVLGTLEVLMHLRHGNVTRA